MKNKIMLILLILFAGLMSTSAFAGKVDFDQVISDSQKSEKDLASQLNQMQPPSKVDHKGLIGKGQKMKRQVLDGTGGSVASQGSDKFFKTQKPKLGPDEKKDQQRLATEIEQGH